MPAFDPDDPAFVADPHPVYAALRADAPVSWWEAGGLHLVARHADVDALLRDRRLGRVFHPLEPQDRFAPWNRLNELSILEMEGPDHTRLRRLVSKEFTPRRVEGLRPRIAALTDALLDDAVAAHGDEVDLVPALAEPLPVVVIAELLGVPEADRHLLRPWSNAIVALYEPVRDEAVVDAAVQASVDFTAYLGDLVAARREDPGEDLISALAVASTEGDRLTTDELIGTAILLLNAGHEASVNVLSNGFAALLTHPDQLAAVREDRSLVPRAVEEFMRWDTPLSMFTRTAFADVEVAGTAVREGEQVGLLLGSANRDDAVFADPDRFDVTRRDNPHVAFGAGIHFCLGAPLARLEIQIALDRVLDRFPAMALAGDPVRRRGFQFRGHSSVPARLR